MTLDVGKHLALARKMDNGVISSTSANLKKFVDCGGKLIIYHGWGDQNVAPLSSVEYYEKLVKKAGEGAIRPLFPALHGPRHGIAAAATKAPTFLRRLPHWKNGKTKKIAPQEVIALQMTTGSATRTPPCACIRTWRITRDGQHRSVGKFCLPNAVSQLTEGEMDFRCVEFARLFAGWYSNARSGCGCFLQAPRFRLSPALQI